MVFGALLPDDNTVFRCSVHPIAGFDVERGVEGLQISDGSIRAIRLGRVRLREERLAQVFVAVLRTRDAGPAEEEALVAGQAVDDWRRLAVEREVVRLVGDRQAA